MEKTEDLIRVFTILLALDVIEAEVYDMELLVAQGVPVYCLSL